MFRPGSPLPSTGHAAESAMNSAGAGQPRPLEDARQPTAAERVRTLVESNASTVLSIPGTDSGELDAGAPTARTVTADGDVLLLVPGDSPAARAAAHAQDDDLTAMIEITDVAPVAVPHRIRGRGWIAGWLTSLSDDARADGVALLAERHPVGDLLGVGRVGAGGWTVLRLETGEAAVDDLWGAESVEPDELAAAEPDPLVHHEAELLQHLAAAHEDQVRGLCTLLGERAATGGCGLGGRAAVPVGLDRYGLRVRFADTGEGIFDARFDFPDPVTDVTELRRAMHQLFEASIED